MPVSFLTVLLAIGFVGVPIVGLIVLGVLMMCRSGNRKADDVK